MKTQDFGSATNRQRYALFCIYKKDFRKEYLSSEDASRLIQEGNSAKGYHKTSAVSVSPKIPQKGNSKTLEDDLLDFFKSHVSELDNKLKLIFEQVSIVQDDLNPSGKKYLFFGGGCGFAWIEFDRRSKLAKSIYEAFGKIRPKFVNWYISTIPQDKLLQLEKFGSPLQAIIAQDLSIQEMFISWVMRYMDSCGVKNLSFRSRLD